MSNLRNKDVVHANKTSNNVVCICKSHYIDCLIKELCIENSLGNLAYAQSTHTKRKSWKIIGLLCVLLEIQIQPMDFRYSTTFLNYISVPMNNVIWMGLPNAPQNLFPNYYYLI
jgi:hypothetical protein